MSTTLLVEVQDMDDILGLASNDVDDDQVEYALSLSRGRGSVTDGASASTLRVNFLSDVNTSSYLGGVEIGGAITLWHADQQTLTKTSPRFKGRVTDITLEHNVNGRDVVVAVTAIGAIAEANARTIGTDPLPEQMASARFYEVLGRSDVDLGGFAQISDPDMLLREREARDESVTNALQVIADSIGACIFDNAYNEIVMQRYRDRVGLVDYRPHGNWEDVPTDWWETDGNWNGAIDGTILPTLELPCDAVVWEPTFRQFSGNIANDFTVKYLDQSVRYEAAESVTKYGRRKIELDTDLMTEEDARVRTVDMARIHRGPAWTMDAVEVRLDKLDASTFQDLTMHEIIGRRVMITDLPQPSPAHVWTGYVEGVSEAYTPGSWTMTLALSPLHWSGELLPWEDATVEWTLGDSSWDEAVSIDALTGGP